MTWKDLELKCGNKTGTTTGDKDYCHYETGNLKRELIVKKKLSSVEDTYLNSLIIGQFYAQGHKTSKWLNQNLKPDGQTLELVLTTSVTTFKSNRNKFPDNVIGEN